ncbi:ComEC/Rec2 family competence protein [Roseivirga sp.]|uniref:ComEC/Rec2 family competence protein n=1 Tax=Roseivirga sp. TaxID=1964215 RepID=UPI003B8DDA06
MRITLSFVLGILAYHYLDGLSLIPWSVILLLFITYFLTSRKRTYAKQVLLSTLSLIILFGLGAWRLHLFKGDPANDHVKDFRLNDVAAYKGVIINAPEEKAKTIQCTIEVYALWDGKMWHATSDRVSAYVSPEKGSSLAYGDLLWVTGRPNLVAGPVNPGQFDYRQYLSYQLIDYQHFIGDNFSLIGQKPPSLVMKAAFKLRARSIASIKKYIKDEYAQGVTLALVLGAKDGLQEETLKAFSATGAMHVLAVSGLHVGIIYALIFMVLKRLGLSQRKYRWTLSIICILTLWVYAFLTGLSPSVLRAVTMFSFVAIGKALSRNSSIYNILAASALALLIYNPYLIVNVGFQLSYIAVFGIVYLQPKLYDLLKPKNFLIEKIWAITSVSIAAQIATAPLSMLYFHQFPTYFLVSNLVVIPAAFIILLMGLAVLLFSVLSSLAAPIAWLLIKIILVVNAVILNISQWSGSTIEGIYLTGLDTFLIYGLLIGLALFFVKKRFVYLKAAFFLAVVFSASQLSHYQVYSNSRAFSILSVTNVSAIDFRSGFQTKLISDSSFQSDIDQQKFNLYPMRLLSGGAQNIVNDDLEVESIQSPLGQLFYFDGLILLHLDKEIADDFNPEQPIEVDCLILGRNALRDISQLEEKIIYKNLVIDSTNSWFVDKQLSRQLIEAKIDFHSVRQNGYYRERWNSSM